MWITALELSAKDNKHQLIDVLKKIKNSEKLSSNYDNIHLLGEEIKQSNKLKIILGKKPNPVRVVFKMIHAGIKMNMNHPV